MFVFYEHVQGPSTQVPNVGVPLYQPNILYTELVLSSDGRTDAIDWKRANERPQAEIITQFLKQINPQFREYEASTHIWTFLGDNGVKVIGILSQAVQGKLLSDTKAIHIKDLRKLHSMRNLSWTEPPKYTPKAAPEVKIKFDAESFFHAPPPPKNTGVPSGEELYKRLSLLMNVDVSFIKTASKEEQKKKYRLAAISLHPDRPGGDASKMSELNMLWSVFNAG